MNEYCYKLDIGNLGLKPDTSSKIWRPGGGSAIYLCSLSKTWLEHNKKRFKINHKLAKMMPQIQGLYWISGKMSYRKTSQSLEFPGFGVEAMLPRHLSNFRIGGQKHISCGFENSPDLVVWRMDKYRGPMDLYKAERSAK